MENFRRQFLIEAAANLHALTENFQVSKAISDAAKRDAFRTLHTIKGTAQTFGFGTASRLAHELETLLSVTKNFEDAESKNFFLEGIGFLIASLEEKDFEIPQAFAEKIHYLVPATAQNIATDFSTDLPDEFFTQLTVQEKNAVRVATESGKNLFCFEVGYELATFADALVSFRELLSESGEIIATLPGANQSGDGRINFQILYASRASATEISAMAKAGAARKIFDSSSGILTQIVKHGAATAKKNGKQIEFDVSADEPSVPPEQLKLIFDCALHLVRNAVDHAIERTGKIQINLLDEKDGWRLTIADDGRGIDLKKIRAKAIAENRIADEFLTERETIDLIFLPEFSTAAEITNTSGRGVGLDAVRSAVEKTGGTITVESRDGQGTTFEIFLPR